MVARREFQRVSMTPFDKFLRAAVSYGTPILLSEPPAPAGGRAATTARGRAMGEAPPASAAGGFLALAVGAPTHAVTVALVLSSDRAEHEAFVAEVRRARPRGVALAGFGEATGATATATVEERRARMHAFYRAMDATPPGFVVLVDAWCARTAELARLHRIAVHHYRPAASVLCVTSPRRVVDAATDAAFVLVAQRGEGESLRDFARGVLGSQPQPQRPPQWRPSAAAPRG